MRTLIMLGASRLAVMVLCTCVMALGLATPATAAGAQKRFESPEPAVDALVSAARAGDKAALLAILGRDAESLVSSGDRVADRQRRERFVAAYDEVHHLVAGGGKIVLHVGKDDFPFPIPLVPDGPVWRFDTAAGKEEMLNRRIGENELWTIQSCLAFVDAQREYYRKDRDKDGYLDYAQRLISSPGKRDGLYWPTKPGERPSPLGDVYARARAEGYDGSKTKPAPYHGYYYKVLTAQGPDAPGGAYDYIVRGRMIGGFALVAVPARYGVSGVMSFMVNHDGVVYQKDLGPRSVEIGKQMKAFNPDATWKRVAQ
jgi:hypothetical protein